MMTLQIVGAWLVIGTLLVIGLRLSERQYCAKTGEPRTDVPLLVNAVLMVAWPLPIYLLWRLWTKREHYRMCGWCRELLPDKAALMEHLKTCEAGPYKPLKAENTRLHALLDGVVCAICDRPMLEHDKLCEREG